MEHPPTPSPSQRAAELVVRAFNLPPWNKNYTLKYAHEVLENCYSAKPFLGVFAKRDNLLVGLALASRQTFGDRTPYYWLNVLCVDPQFHRRGVGHSLTTMIIKKACAQKMPFVRLSTLCDCPAADMYEKFGFEAISAPSLHSGQVTLSLRL